MTDTNHNRFDEIQGEILHVYDGIEEADNELPNWWLWTFYGAIVFSVFYWFAYHEFGALKLPGAELSAALQERAASGGEVTEDLLVAMSTDSEAVSAGSALFATNCAVCHKERGEGNIGPNLTDGFWIHGGAPVDIHRTVNEGVLTAGMPAWGAALGPQKVQQLTAFLLTIRDTNVPGKEPQGEPVGAPAAEGAAPVIEGAAAIVEGAAAAEAAAVEGAQAVEGAAGAAVEAAGAAAEAAGAGAQEAAAAVENVIAPIAN